MWGVELMTDHDTFGSHAEALERLKLAQSQRAAVEAQRALEAQQRERAITAYVVAA